MASRGPAPIRRRTHTERTFPVLPIAIGMVVVGLVIGAALGTQRQRNNAVTVAVATPTVAKPTLAPGPVMTVQPQTAAPAEPSATPASTEQPTPTPPPAPSPRHTVRPTTAPSSPAASPVPSPVATAKPVAAAPRTAPAKAPAAKSPAPARAAQRRTMPIAVAQVSAAPPPAQDSAEEGLASDARQTVRTYLQALIAGDESTASAQLLANTGTAAARLSERDFLDASARIVGISARATSATTASVDADIQTANGLYYGHYEVRRLDTGVTLIREHSFVKS